MILNGDNAYFLEELYKQFQKDAQQLSPEWAHYFKVLEGENGANGKRQNGGLQALKPILAQTNILDQKELGVQSLIESYRRFGNLAANIDPLDIRLKDRELLQLAHYGLSNVDLKRAFNISLEKLPQNTLQKIIEHFESTYCHSIGVEYAYIRNNKERDWLEERMEATANSETLDTPTKLALYTKLYQAEAFEKFLARKFVGKKRFSLEGCESFIPMLDTIIELGAELGVECIVMGMAHRGRLNVLVNVMQKPVGLIFAEFYENYNSNTIDYADVKYHLGYSSDRITRNGKKIHASLAFNPSHLEAVSPVVLGSIRARQEKYNDDERRAHMPILVHGDAAFMGQGVVAETLNLAGLEGYNVGGTVHIIINNQIGFTTLPPESRSTEYATDLAKGFQTPIFHVNADDPEAVYRATKLSLEYRQNFRKDVIIDLVGYRRLGHNETDEPAFTQPLMYSKIKQHLTAVKIYQERLRQDGIPNTEIANIEAKSCIELEENFARAKTNKIQMKVDTMKGPWAGYTRTEGKRAPQTKLLRTQLERIAKAITEIPTDFYLHPKLQRLLANRRKMFEGEIPVDWGFAEALAFGSILERKHNIRLSGQDAKRGTFSHRHCVFTDTKNGEEYIPLNFISKEQANFEVCNSPLSEFSVLGFEFGYSLADPHCMVVWEAQFGDFANSAQIIFDQFIASSEVKWYRMSGLVVLLPHGYEGQGPEHSSARLERFLQLCANENMLVCNCTTAAQYFHLLRRQAFRKTRKPLILLTPKSLLRLPEAGSPTSEITNNDAIFRPILYDKDAKELAKTRRVLFCSGKIYYELEENRKMLQKKDIQIVRIEQLYPFPKTQMQEALSKMPVTKEFAWVQEEPQNQGAWNYVQGLLKDVLPVNSALECIARPKSASPAAGLFKVHQREQNELMQKAIQIK